MKIVAISPFLPYEGVAHAGGEFLLRHLGHVGTHHEVALVGLASSETNNPLEHVPAIPNLVSLLQFPSTRALLSRLQRRCLALLRWSVLVAPRGELTKMLGPAAHHLRSADVVELHWGERIIPLLAAIKRLAPGAIIAIVLYDLPWLADARRRDLDASSWIKRRILTASLLIFRRWEVRLMGRADVALVFKQQDCQLLREAGLQRPALVIDPPLQAPQTQAHQAGRSRPLSHNVLLTGAFDRAENYRSALWFLDQVWPAVEAQCPEARCVIAGAHPPELLLERATSNVIITGYVSSLAGLYGDAAVFVAPLLAGAGLKFKVPQAMLFGLPVVATPIAAEGVIEEAGPTRFAVVTNEPQAMARSIVDLLTRPDHARAVGDRARRWAVERYDFAASTDRVLSMYNTLAHGSPAGAGL